MLRNTLLATRNALSPNQRRDATEAIGRQLLDCSADVVATFWPIRGEPDLRPIWHELARRGLTLALPLVTSTDAPLTFVTWTPGQPMTRDQFGVAIPSGQLRKVTPDLLLIPCLGVNVQRVRLGYGGGLYDRTLAAMPSVATLGIAFDCARVEFDAEPHDIPLQAVITESGRY
jgi:5,10-methenyltetrahydrofolate synthetase